MGEAAGHLGAQDVAHLGGREVLGLNSVGAQWRLPVTAFAGISGLIVVLAQLWLARFSKGPPEWLWTEGCNRLVTRNP